MKSTPENTKVKGTLLLLGIIALLLLMIPFCLTPPAKLVIRLKDDVFKTDLAGKEVRLSLISSDKNATVLIRRNGKENIAVVERIKSGPNDLEIHIKGYNTNTISIDIPPLETTITDVSLTPDFGKVKVFAVNARKKDEYLARFNVEDPVSKHIIPGGKQGATLELDPGTFHIQLKAPGFCPTQCEITVKPGKIVEKKVLMSPKVSGNELARVILDWGPSPRDLDAHLFLPKSPLLKNQHVYYPKEYMLASLRNGSPGAVLDVDYTESQGYETVTIYRQIKGTYKYIVHQDSAEGNIGSSGATVELVTNGCEKRKFYAPAGCTKSWWHVFDLEFNGTDMQVVVKNQCLTQKELGVKTGKGVLK